MDATLKVDGPASMLAHIGEHVHERALFLGIGLLASVHVTPDGWERLDRPGQSGTAEQVRDSIMNAEMIARGSVVRDAAPADVPFTGAPDAAERIAAVAPKRPRAAVAWWHAVINADRTLLPATPTSSPPRSPTPTRSATA